MPKRIEVGDWIRVPHRRYGGPFEAHQVVRKGDTYKTGCVRVEFKVKDGNEVLFQSYPVSNVEKITEAEAMLLKFESEI